MSDFNSTELFGNMEEGGGEQGAGGEALSGTEKANRPRGSGGAGGSGSDRERHCRNGVIESRYGGSDAVGDGQEGFVDPHAKDGDAVDSDAGEGGNDSDGADQSRARKQTREDNAAIRAARLRAQHDTAARMAAEADERIARSGVLNPATGRPFQNMQELESYGAAQRESAVRQIARHTGRSVETVRAELEKREIIRGMSESMKMQKNAAAEIMRRNDFLMRDVQDFKQKHPDVNVAKLEQSESFRRFCGSRYGVESLASLYDDYKTVVGGAESAARAGAESRKSRSTGSGGTGGERLSAQQRASLDAWNRANPDMKMTAKEFLAK